MKLKYPASHFVSTPSGKTYACEKHLSAIRAIYRVLGCNTEVIKLNKKGKHECDNCVNENSINNDT